MVGCLVAAGQYYFLREFTADGDMLRRKDQLQARPTVRANEVPARNHASFYRTNETTRLHLCCHVSLPCPYPFAPQPHEQLIVAPAVFLLCIAATIKSATSFRDTVYIGQDLNIEVGLPLDERS